MPNHEIGPSDRFRAFGDLTKRDRRQLAHAFDPISRAPRERTLREHYDAIALLELQADVPVDVRIHFDTARMLLVHSWFAYRFIQVAEAHALGAVEMALRVRLGVEARVGRGLKRLLQDAVDKGLLKDCGFRHQWLEGDRPDPGRAGLSDTALRLVAEGRSQPDEYVRILVDQLPWYRNDLAHGSSMLAGGGRVVLSICRDVIDQLFGESWHSQTP
jgi:hypothetical protein